MKYIIAILLSLIACQSFAQHVVISEIMYAPFKPEPEWVELYNPLGTAIPIYKWTIANHLHAYQLPRDTLGPNEYVVLTKDSTHFLRQKYAIISGNIIETTIPALSNSGDYLVIKDSLGVVIDSVRYSPTWGGANGRSIERIDYLAPNDSSNFGSSIDTTGATPCAPNSIRRRDTDLTIDSLQARAINHTDLAIDVVILNKGRNPVSNAAITLVSTNGVLLSQIEITSPIEPLQNQRFELLWQNADFGKSNVYVIVNATGDEVGGNDTAMGTVYLPVEREAVILNEIMATPPIGSSQWLEIYNNSQLGANMDSTFLHTSVGTKIYKFVIDSLYLQPKQYAVICADTNFYKTFPLLQGKAGIRCLGKSDLRLKDSGNQILLLNSNGSMIDSLHDYSSWYPPALTDHTGISLERKSFTAPSDQAENWTSSVDPSGSTPLRKNSFALDTTPTPSVMNIAISPNPFSPDGDGFEDATTIAIVIPRDNIELISIKLYDLRGRLCRTLEQNFGVFHSATIPFNGKDENGITLPVGLYVLVVESADALFASQRRGVVIMKKPR